MMSNLKQLALNLCLRDTASFSNFFVGKNNFANMYLVRVLENLYAKDAPFFVYLWGKSGSGKSHLLGSLCQAFGEQNLNVAYLPLEDAAILNPSMCDDLEEMHLLCIDDLECVAGDLSWEEKIFYCFKKAESCGGHIVITADAPPAGLQLALSDLKSRMASGLIFEVQELGEMEKIESLKMRANLRGLELGDTVAKFLLNRYARDTKSLFEMLDKLDRAALAACRKLTIPFIKEILER